MISTRDLSRLPDIDALQRLMQSLAMLEAILSPEWQYRIFSYDRRWGADQQLATMRDGSGDEWFCVFGAEGAFFKGFAHESPMSPWCHDPPRLWPGLLEGVPAAFAALLKEPALDMEATTFCLWRERGDGAWRRGAIAFPEDRDPDGSGDLLANLDGDPAGYQTRAEAYHERPIALAAIKRVYRHEPLSADLVRVLNDDVTVVDLAPDADEIGYPR